MNTVQRGVLNDPVPNRHTKQEATVPASARFFRGDDLAYVAVFAALIAALSIVPGFNIGPVPFTLQTVGVGLAGLCLGPWRGFASVLLYLLVGAAGLPVFARGGAGLASFAGPTGGYLIAFPFAALLAGFVAILVLKRGLSAITPVICFLGLLAGRYLIILPLGVFGLMRAGGMDFGKAFGIDMGFWVSDAIKSVIVAILAYAVHRAFPRLLAQR